MRMKRTIIGIVAGLAFVGLLVSQSPSEAKAKPTTTTAATTTTTTVPPVPTLGVPTYTPASTTVAGNSVAALVMDCPSGQVVLSGGFTVDPGANMVIERSEPRYPPNFAYGWVVRFRNTGTTELFAGGHVVCAPIVN